MSQQRGSSDSSSWSESPQRIALIDAAPEAEACRHSTETKAVAFVDCCGFTAYTFEHGDDAAASLHLDMRDHIEASAANAGALVLKWTGDGAMLVADDLRAVMACLYESMVAARRTRALPLRGGATVGPVARITRGGLDYLGASVNRAFRLCAGAAPWQVRVEADHRQARINYTLRAEFEPTQPAGAKRLVRNVGAEV